MSLSSPMESLEERLLLSATNPFELSSLLEANGGTGSTGFNLNGAAAQDSTGQWGQSAGDVNGDGQDDILISADNADVGGFGNVGVVYLVFGTVEGTQPSLELSSLDGTSGFVFNGVARSDSMGSLASQVGDVNGDGFDDLLFGAWRADPHGQASGAAYLVFGGPSNLSTLDAVTDTGGVADDGRINLADLDGTTGFVFNGNFPYDHAGNVVSGAGDVNGDGFDDLMISAPGVHPDDTYDSSYGTYSGAVYVVFGGTSNLSALDAVTSTGGTAGDGRIKLADLDGATGVIANGFGGAFGGAGDVNGDGFDDLLFGASFSDPNGAMSGASHVVFGGPSNLSTLDAVTSSGGTADDGQIDLIDLDATTGFIFNGVAAGDRSGHSVSIVGDVNGDGFDDLLIAAPYADPNGLTSGASYVVFGGPTNFSTLDAMTSSGGVADDGQADLADLDGSTGFVLNGIAADDRSGRAVSRAGDVNGDGFDDLIIGANLADPNGVTLSGSSYVIFGGTANLSALDSVTSSGGTAGDAQINLADLNGTNGFVINGAAEKDYSGAAVSGAGDFNGDGFDDLIIGAPGSDPNGERSGASHVVFGGNFTGGGETQVGTPSADTLTGTAGPDVLIGGRRADLLIGNGGADVLIGGEGNDALSISSTAFARVEGGNGTDSLRLDGSGIFLDLTAISDNRITDIEKIDISGSGSNTLTLDVREVLNVSSASNTLLVQRDDDDTVNIGDGWTSQANQTIDAINYDIFTQGNAILGIQDSTSDVPQTVSLPTGGGDFVISVADSILEIRQAALSLVVASFSIDTLGDLTINGSSSDDRVTLENLDGYAGTVIFNAGAGDDVFDASASALNTIVQGDAGDDSFLGGSGADRFVGGSGSDSAKGGDGSDSLIGNGGDDTLSGDEGDDFLNGNAGRDLLTGNAGNDTVFGGSGTDTLDGGSGADFVNGQGGRTDIVAGGGGADTLRGGASDVVIPGSVDTLPASPPTAPGSGSTLNVTLPEAVGPFTVLVDGSSLKIISASETISEVALQGISDVSILGSSGDDSVILDASLEMLIGSVTFNGEAGHDSFDSSAVSMLTSFVGGAGNDTLTGGGGRDLFLGGAGDDSASGGAGNDVLNGNSGKDSLFGGEGDDRLLGGRDADLLDGGVGSDVVNGQSGKGDTVAGGGGGTDSLLGDPTDTLIDGPSGDGPDSAVPGGIVSNGVLTVTLPAEGGSFNVLVSAGQIQVVSAGGSTPLVDELFAGLTDIVINGGAGEDSVMLDATLTVITGTVTFNGFSGDDSLDSSSSAASVVFHAGDGDDTLLGGSGNDVANGGAGNDSIVTGAGTDLIDAGSGDDFVDAGTDADTVFGEAGDDLLIGGDGNDFVKGNDGWDTISGGNGNDFLNGNGGRDTITGEDGNDTLLGGAHRDSLDGGLGDDLVRGQGGGSDTAVGGGGIDVVVP